MENGNVSYLKTDDDKIINEQAIKWVKKMNDCLLVCTKSTGCSLLYGDTNKICKANSPFSYHKLIKHFE
jgi:hypothetical protein